MIKFSFATLLFSLFTSLPMFAAAAATAGGEDASFNSDAGPERPYKAGSLSNAMEPWGGPTKPKTLSLGCGHSIRLPAHFRELEARMSPVKRQGLLGSCTAFAVVACLECLATEKVFSESELYLRVKTKGGSSRKREGVNLQFYIPLVEEGVVESRFFPEYVTYVRYVKSREGCTGKNAAVAVNTYASHLSTSSDYLLSLKEFLCWCELKKYTLPDDLKPKYKHYEKHTRERFIDPTDLDVDKVPLMRRWRYVMRGGSLLKAIHITEEYTTGIIEEGSYHTGFSCIPLGSPNNIIELKTMLIGGSPIAIGVDIVKLKEVPNDIWDDLVWKPGWTYNMGPNVIDIPTKDWEKVESVGHAICICGYDDRMKAFRFKNSWGTRWADEGCAWITYDYIKECAHTAIAVKH